MPGIVEDYARRQALAVEQTERDFENGRRFMEESLSRQFGRVKQTLAQNIGFVKQQSDGEISQRLSLEAIRAINGNTGDRGRGPERIESQAYERGQREAIRAFSHQHNPNAKENRMERTPEQIAAQREAGLQINAVNQAVERRFGQHSEDQGVRIVPRPDGKYYDWTFSNREGKVLMSGTGNDIEDIKGTIRVNRRFDPQRYAYDTPAPVQQRRAQSTEENRRMDAPSRIRIDKNPDGPGYNWSVTNKDGVALSSGAGADLHSVMDTIKQTGLSYETNALRAAPKPAHEMTWEELHPAAPAQEKERKQDIGIRQEAGYGIGI